tara:strand:- start:1267 stop:1839 length:573 start_codon:yes stop_codon:yes gene_type:complete
MGFFRTVSAASKATKISNKITKVSSAFINLLITDGVTLKTHDSLKIILTIKSNYDFTALLLIHSQESKDFKEKFLGLVCHNIAEEAKKIIYGDTHGLHAGWNPEKQEAFIVEEFHSLFEPQGEGEKIFREWMTIWKKNYGSLTEINFEIEENTSTILMDFLNQQFNLSSAQSQDFKTTIFEMLKNNKYDG